MPTSVYYVYTYLTLFRYQVQLFCLRHLSTNHAASCKVRRCGKRISEMWSAEYLESAEKLLTRRYIVGILTKKANISIYSYLVPYRLSTDSKTRDLEWPFCVKFCFAPVRLELWSLAFEAWLYSQTCSECCLCVMFSVLMVLIKQRSFFVILPIFKPRKTIKAIKTENITHKQNMTLILWPRSITVNK